MKFKWIFCVLQLAVASIILLMYKMHCDSVSTNRVSPSYKIISGIENTLASNTPLFKDTLKAAVTSIATANKKRYESTTKAVLIDLVDRAEDNTLPDCMELRKKDPYPTEGTPAKGRNLCKAYSTGTNRTDCVYKHPEVFNYVLLTKLPCESVLNFREYLSIIILCTQVL